MGDDDEMRLKRNKCEGMILIHMLQNKVHFSGSCAVMTRLSA